FFEEVAVGREFLERRNRRRMPRHAFERRTERAESPRRVLEMPRLDVGESMVEIGLGLGVGAEPDTTLEHVSRLVELLESRVQPVERGEELRKVTGLLDRSLVGL